MIRNSSFTRSSALLAAALAPASAAAQSVCHTVPVPATTTNWSTSIAVPKFDPANHVLTAVRFTLFGQEKGAAKFESLDSASSTVTMTFQCTETLTRPDASVILVAIPEVQFVDGVAAFDGVVDFGGTSGKTYPNVIASESVQLQSTDPADLALFTGPAGNPGTIDLPIDAMGTSSATGPGNLIVQFQQQAEAIVQVCYDFAPDCNHNGVPDAEDIANGTSLDVNVNGIADDCERPIFDYCPGDGPANGGPDCPCGNWVPGNPAGCLNSTGAGGLLAGTGNASVSNDTLVLSAGDLPPLAPGYFFQGTSAVAGGTGTPFGAGLICMGGSVIRMAKIVSSPQFGTVTLPFAGDPPISQQFSIPAGSTRFYQVWYRNNGGPCGLSFNTTNGVRIHWSI